MKDDVNNMLQCRHSNVTQRGRRDAKEMVRVTQLAKHGSRELANA